MDTKTLETAKAKWTESIKKWDADMLLTELEKSARVTLADGDIYDVALEQRAILRAEIKARMV